MGAPTTTAKGTIHIGEYGIAGILQYTGSGHSSNRVIKLEVTGATVDASGSGTLTFSGGVNGSADNLILTGTGSAVQSGVIATTSGTVTKNGTGTWTLSGANTYTGTTTVNAGVLNIQHATALGTSAAGTTVNTGAALEIQGGITVTAETLTLNGTGISSGGALRNISGSNVWQTSVTLGSAVRIQSDAGSLTFNTAANSITATNQNLSLGGAGTGTVSGTITTGSGSLTKDGSGTWTLAGANTFTGGVNLNAGTLNINHATALGTVAGTFAIADGTTINNTSAGSVTISANNPMNWNGNFTFTGTQALNLGTGNVAMGSSLRTVTVSASTLTVGGTISGTGGLTKEGAGALTLGSVAANNWTGTTTINGGTLTTGTQNGSDYYQSESWIINNGGTLVSGSNNIIANTAIITVNTGGTWNTNSRQETIAYIAGGGNITNMSYAGTAIQLDLGTAGSGSDFSGVISGTGNLVIRGNNSGGTTSQQVLSGSNSYSGSTTVNGGILNIRHANALGTSAAGTTVASGAALEIQGGITVSAEALTLNGTGISSGGALRNISGTNVWQSTVTLGSAVRINSDAGTLTFNTAANSITATNQNLSLGGSGNGTVSGTITTGSGTFTKDGSGTWTVSGANTFTGGSTLNAGTLNINNASSLGTVAGTFTINGGAIDNTSAGNITTANYPLVINGDFSYTGSVPRNLNLGTGAVTFSTNPQLTVNAGTLTLGGTISESTRSLTKAGGGTLSFGSNTVSLNNLTISAGTLTATSGTMNIAGNFSNSGTFTHNSGLVTFNGSSAQSIGGTATVPFNNITLNNASGLSLATNATVAGTLTLGNGSLTTSSSSLITLNAGSSVSGASSTSFINGPVKKIGNSAFTFPVGKSAVYEPLSISAPSVITDAFTAEYMRASGTGLGPVSAPGLYRVSNCDYWNLDRTAGTSSVNVTLSWNGFSNCNMAAYVNDLATITVAHFNGSTWDAHGRSSSTGNASSGTVTWDNVSTFSPFALGSTSDYNNPLELGYISLKAGKLAGGIKISWTNPAELDINHYSVERSGKTGQFTPVQQVTATINNGTETGYSWMDTSPATETNYYRIKAVRYDGKFMYSPTVKIDGNQGPELLLYPNPVTENRFTIATGFTGFRKVQLRITDMNGRNIFNRSVMISGAGSGQLIHLPAGMKAGVYSLLISGDNFSRVKTFIVE